MAMKNNIGILQCFGFVLALLFNYHTVALADEMPDLSLAYKTAQGFASEFKSKMSNYQRSRASRGVRKNRRNYDAGGNDNSYSISTGPSIRQLNRIKFVKEYKTVFLKKIETYYANAENEVSQKLELQNARLDEIDARQTQEMRNDLAEASRSLDLKIDEENRKLDIFAKKKNEEYANFFKKAQTSSFLNRTYSKRNLKKREGDIGRMVDRAICEGLSKKDTSRITEECKDDIRGRPLNQRILDKISTWLDNDPYLKKKKKVRKIKKIKKKILKVVARKLEEGLLAELSKSVEIHSARNKFNREAKGTLMLVKDNLFIDEAGCLWELQSSIKNIFHIRDRTLKFLRLDRGENQNIVGQHETIRKLMNDESVLDVLFAGDNLRTGKKQQTYNFGTNIFSHSILDMLSHIAYSDYKEFPPEHGQPTNIEKRKLLKIVFGKHYTPKSQIELDEDFQMIKGKFRERLKKHLKQKHTR